MVRLLRTRQLQIHLWLCVTPDSMGAWVTAGNLEQSMEAFLSRFEAGFCLIKNNKHSNHWTRKYTKYHSVLTKLRLGCLSCAVVGEQRCWREVSRPQLQSNCNGHLSITFTYSWQKFSTLKQARRWNIHNVLIKIWITFFHLLWVLISWSRKNNWVNIQNCIFSRADWWKYIRRCCLHMSLLLSPQLISETVLRSPGILAMVMDMQSVADQKCDFCSPKHWDTNKWWIYSIFWMRLCYKGKHLKGILI